MGQDALSKVGDQRAELVPRFFDGSAEALRAGTKRRDVWSHNVIALAVRRSSEPQNKVAAAGRGCSAQRDLRQKARRLQCTSSW